MYFYLSAAASAVLGGGLLPLRFVSFVASLALFAATLFIVRKETESWLSVGLFAASFRLAGAWLDIARVDSLSLALWLWFVYLSRDTASLAKARLAGFLVALAFLTKQTALVVCSPVIAYLAWRNWKYALVMLGVAASVIGVTTLILSQASSGWYVYYIFELLSQQTEWRPLRFLTFWTEDLLLHLPVAVLAAIFFLTGRPIPNQPVLIRWLSILTGAIAGTFLTRVKVGGYDNVLLPAYAAISILFGLGLHEILKEIKASYPGSINRMEAMVYAACLIQLATLSYNPFAQIPTDADRKAGFDLVKYISEVNGEVYLPDHSYLAALAGKNTHAHHAAIWDVVRGNPQTTGNGMLTEDLNQAIQNQFFDVIILDSDWNLCCSLVDQHYTMVGEFFQDPAVFFPVTGWRKRPTFIYVANRLR